MVHEKNGLLIPAKDTEALANAMIRLLKEKNEKIENMAKESFLIASNKYEINIINQNIIEIMNL